MNLKATGVRAAFGFFLVLIHHTPLNGVYLIHTPLWYYNGGGGESDHTHTHKHILIVIADCGVL